MPASITLSNLSWSTPDGRPVLSNLDLSFGSERSGLVGRNGVGKTHAAQADRRRSVAAVRRGVGHRHARHAAPERPDRSARNDRRPVRHDRGARRCCAAPNAAKPTPTSSPVPTGRLRPGSMAALGRLGLQAGPETLLSTLSGGQQTRAWGWPRWSSREPDFLLLDEPTNNLDRDGRRAVIDLLADWRTGAIVVSHDRELLETMDAIVELTALGATRYGGNWSHYRERKALELAAAQHDLADAERRVAEVARTRRRRRPSERPARTASASKKRGRGDIPRIQLDTLQQPQRSHRRRERPVGRTPARTGPGRCRGRPRTHRGAAAVDRCRSGNRACRRQRPCSGSTRQASVTTTGR